MSGFRGLFGFMENAAHQLGDGDMSGDQTTGADFECICTNYIGLPELHYEWDHKKAQRRNGDGTPTTDYDRRAR